ncbi:PIR protein [Plasmodium vivax]|nr:PIR protein [Plasmodium vivax]
MGYATNYNFASNAHEYKKVLDSYARSSYNNYDAACKSVISGYGIRHNLEAQEACRLLMGYLRHIAENGSWKDSANKCKYLYYWLHDHLLINNTPQYTTFSLYKKLLDVYRGNGYYPHLCNNYIDDIEKIKLLNATKLIELYTIFRNEQRTPGKCYCSCASECYSLHKKYVVECNNQKDEDFCSELENFKYLYDRNMRSIGTCNNAPKTLESVKPNVPSSPIVFPLMLALAMHSLLFILYKFTPIASSLKRRNLRKKIKYGNDYTEQNEYSHNPSTSNMESTVPYYLLSYGYNRDT